MAMSIALSQPDMENGHYATIIVVGERRFVHNHGVLASSCSAGFMTL
jgi:hypothetical protein